MACIVRHVGVIVIDSKQRDKGHWATVYIVLAGDECWLLNIIQTCVCVCLNLCMRVIFDYNYPGSLAGCAQASRGEGWLQPRWIHCPFLHVLP